MGKSEIRIPVTSVGLFFLVFCLFNCSTSKYDAQLPFSGIQNLKPVRIPRGEKLEYIVHSPLFRIGKIEIKTDSVQSGDSACFARIWAQAHSAEGLGWLTDIHHYWSTQMDTCLGISLSMERRVKENKYSTHQRLIFLPDSLLIKESRPDKPERPIRSITAQPSQMADLLLTFFRLRFQPFEKMKSGDTIRQICFFDGEWLHFKLIYRGQVKETFRGLNRKAYLIQPLGVQSAWLSGTFPVDLLIDTEKNRTPLRISVHSRLGKLEGILSTPFP